MTLLQLFVWRNKTKQGRTRSLHDSATNHNPAAAVEAGTAVVEATEIPCNSSLSTLNHSENKKKNKKKKRKTNQQSIWWFYGSDYFPLQASVTCCVTKIGLYSFITWLLTQGYSCAFYTLFIYLSFFFFSYYWLDYLFFLVFCFVFGMWDHINIKI